VTRDFRSTIRSSWRSVALAGVCVLLAATPAFSQENPSPENSATGWIFRWINFAIVFGAIVYFFAKVAGPSLRGSSEEISQKIAEGARAREVAEKQRQEVAAKLASIGTEVATLRADAKRGAEAEALRLKALARHEAETIERAAQAEIVAAQRAALLELKALAAQMAVDRAEVVLRGEINPEAQASLFHAFVAELERSAN